MNSTASSRTSILQDAKKHSLFLFSALKKDRLSAVLTLGSLATPQTKKEEIESILSMLRRSIDQEQDNSIKKAAQESISKLQNLLENPSQSNLSVDHQPKHKVVPFNNVHVDEMEPKSPSDVDLELEFSDESFPSETPSSHPIHTNPVEIPSNEDRVSPKIDNSSSKAIWAKLLQSPSKSSTESNKKRKSNTLSSDEGPPTKKSKNEEKLARFKPPSASDFISKYSNASLPPPSTSSLSNLTPSSYSMPQQSLRNNSRPNLSDYSPSSFSVPHRSFVSGDDMIHSQTQIPSRNITSNTYVSTLMSDSSRTSNSNSNSPFLLKSNSINRITSTTTQINGYQSRESVQLSRSTSSVTVAGPTHRAANMFPTAQEYISAANRTTSKPVSYTTSSSSSVSSNGAPKRSLPWPESTQKSTKSSSFSSSSFSSSSNNNSKNTYKKPSGPMKIDRSEYQVDASLSAEQRRIVEKALEGHSFFFTGAAGTGKSYALKEIINIMKQFYESEELQVVAPTGMAAVALNGSTIHSFAGIGLGNETAEVLITKIRKNRYSENRWKNVRVLIIDEVSMLSGELFDKLEAIARAVRRVESPFGGIQLILCGDFFQLPPVPNSKSAELVNQTPQYANLFAFTAKSWKNVVKETYLLTQVFRQIGDSNFVQLLNNLRCGEVSDQVYQQLLKCVGKQLKEDGVEATRLYPLKAQVANHNTTRLDKIKGQVQVFLSRDTSKIPDSPHLKQIKDGCPAPDVLHLKVGAQVVLLKNILDASLVNGSRGTVTGFHVEKSSDLGSSLLPIVQFENGVTRVLNRETWSITVGDEVLASREQIPLNLAWALSIHKSQGMTISTIEVSLKSVFECGQAYVALSRVTSLEGLRIAEHFAKDIIKAHPAVVEFYNSLKTL